MSSLMPLASSATLEAIRNNKMFHKPSSSLGVGSHKKKSMDSPLKKSDRKSLRNAALELVKEAVREECTPILQQAFLEGILTQRKLSLPEGKVLLYTRNPSPDWPYSVPQVIWMSLDDNKKWIHAPTLALLALLPPNSFGTVLVAPAVSKYLCRGAHLMRAGIRSLLNIPSVNGIVVVCVEGNPQPTAVGRLTNCTNMDSVGPESKGIGVEIWTCYGDDLWNSQLSTANENNDSIVSPMGGAPFDNGHYGNVGFIDGKYVLPIVQSDNNANETNTEEPPSSETNCVAVMGSTGDENPGAAVETEQDTTRAEFSTDGPPEPQVDSVQENDMNPHNAVLHQAVCRALVSLKKSDLPMTTANFYAQHVIPKSSTQINLKQTSYKKLGRYLAEQMERNLVTCGPDKDKKDPMAYVVSVNRGHPDLKPYRQEQKDSGEDSSTATKKKLAIVNLYIVPHHFVSLMRLDQDDVKAVHAKSPERQGTGMLTSPEVRAILEKYVTTNELLDPARPTQVRVDGPLCDALYRKQKGNYPTSVSRKDLNSAWLEHMQAAYALVEMPGNHITALSRGTPPKVSIEVSMRQGKKYVTRVRGLEAYGIDGVDFSKDVSKRFACSTTVESNPDGRAALKKGHVEVVIQGHLVEELRALLLGNESLTTHGGAKGGNYCLPKNIIDVSLKKGVPAKKKR